MMDAWQMSCKPPGEEIALKTTLAILNNHLSNYSWASKAVLTLAAFALEYGDFWLLSDQQYQSTEPLAKSLAIIKRVPTLTKPSALQKHRNAILEINNLIKATWHMVKDIFELETLKFTYDTKLGCASFGTSLWTSPRRCLLGYHHHRSNCFSDWFSYYWFVSFVLWFGFFF